MSKTAKITVMLILVLAGLAMAGPTWWLTGWGEAARDLVLYGNVDLRQVALAFNNSERIAAVLSGVMRVWRCGGRSQLHQTPTSISKTSSWPTTGQSFVGVSGGVKAHKIPYAA